MNVFRKPFRYSFFNATAVLIAVNLLCFFVLKLFPDLFIYLGLSHAGLKCHYYWQLVTYLFVHSGYSHVFFNMLALFFFGIPFERSVGSKEFLLFYILCGVADGLFSTLMYDWLGTRSLLVGASGAVYAVLFGYAVAFPRNVIYIWGIIPVAAPLLVLLYGIIEIASQITGADGIAHLAHLFGFAAAWLYFVIRFGVNPVNVWKNAWR